MQNTDHLKCIFFIFILFLLQLQIGCKVVDNSNTAKCVHSLKEISGYLEPVKLKDSNKYPYIFTFAKMDSKDTLNSIPPKKFIKTIETLNQTLISNSCTKDISIIDVHKIFGEPSYIGVFLNMFYFTTNNLNCDCHEKEDGTIESCNYLKFFINEDTGILEQIKYVHNCKALNNNIK